MERVGGVAQQQQQRTYNITFFTSPPSADSIFATRRDRAHVTAAGTRPPLLVHPLQERFAMRNRLTLALLVSLVALTACHSNPAAPAEPGTEIQIRADDAAPPPPVTADTSAAARGPGYVGSGH